MDTWKISKNSDTATQDALSDFIVEVNMTLPNVKTNFIGKYGINGSIDETEALGSVNYDDREVALILVTKSGINNPRLAVDEFINDYVGEKVRLHNITQYYMLIGRITDVRQIKTNADESYKLICSVICEPLRYAETYTPSESGLDITPAALGTNLWNTTNVIPSDVYAETVTASGGTVVANAPYIEGEGNAFIVNTAVTGNGKLIRLYLETFVNCDVEVRYDGKVISKNTHTVLIYTDGGQITINVFRLQLDTAASFDCTIREVTAHTVVNRGKSAPLAISHAYSTGSEIKPKLYVNGTMFNIGVADNGVWDEYAPAILKSGDNIVAAFVNSGTFDPSDASGSIKIRYRMGAL